MSSLTVSPTEIQFSLNNVTQFKVYMIYQDVYLEIGPSYKLGIGKTTPTEDVHIGGNMHLNNPKNITYNSGFKITVNDSPLAFVPIGTVVIWPVPNNATVIDSMTEESISYAGTSFLSLPRGWIYCEGQFLTKSDFPILYAMIGNNYGESGIYFRVPDYRGLAHGNAPAPGIVNRDTNVPSQNMYGSYARPVSIGTIDNASINLGHLPQHRHYGTSTEANGSKTHNHSQSIPGLSLTDRPRGGDPDPRQAINFGFASPISVAQAWFGTGPSPYPGPYEVTTSSTSIRHNHNNISGTSMIRTQTYNPSINLEQPFICLRYIIRIF